MEQAAAADAGAGSATFRACVEFTRLRNILFFALEKERKLRAAMERNRKEGKKWFKYP